MLSRDKTNIKDNTKSILLKTNKINGIKIITKSFETIWKIFYTTSDNKDETLLTPNKFNFLIEKCKNNIIIHVNSFCLGYQNFEPYTTLTPLEDSTFNTTFKLYNYDETEFKLPSKYCPTKTIIITAESGIISGNYIQTSSEYSKLNPQTITLTINIDGTITITDCDFLTTSNIIFYGNSFKINYNI